ncbi:hypothetical protein [Tropicimonas sp. S265A]|uniref:hypothetical protein n=1 Tax=Tropicimonas sp. S265A TaxID=3415134 RepID=UPI003C7E6F62
MYEPDNAAGSNPFGRVRTIPVHTDEPTRTKNDLAASNKDEPGANPPPISAAKPIPFEEVWLTVDEAVAHCAAQGLSRTAKTIRKWAERSFNVPEGEVVSRREDTLWGRYRWKIELKSLERKTAEELSREAENSREPVQTGANTISAVATDIPPKTPTNPSEHVQTSAVAPAEPIPETPSSNMIAPRADVRTGVTSIPVSDINSNELATLRAENKELRKQQDRDQDEIRFLREEVTFNRSLKADFARNSQRLLETLETVAVGGRLERRAGSADHEASEPSQAVRYREEDEEGNRV